jgi:23S rRNA G2069 N7-methylase RlmK/C1962 C5-methylase RlmI
MAFDTLLQAWSSERTLYRDAAFCVVDKPAGVACGSGHAAADAPRGDLRQRLIQHGLGSLAPLSLLPQRASGATLLAFGPGARASAGGRADLPEPLSGLSCVVAIDDCRLPVAGQLRLPEVNAGLRLQYRVTRRQGPRALLEVKATVAPEHVVKAFAQSGQPIVGSDGAPAATRLMLHVSALSGRINAQAPLPAEFESWLTGVAATPPAKFASALTSAGLIRFELGASHEAFRLIAEGGGEISGISVDRYGDYAVLAISSEEAWSLKEEIADCLMDHGARGVYLKRRVRTDLRGADAASLAPPLPLRGNAAPDSLYVRQGPLGFWVRLGDGLATGLFLDQRANWARLREAAEGVSLLNLFCYTGAFTVAAARGGAASTLSVDLAARALSRLRQNLELNGLSGSQHRLFKDDVLTWLNRAARGQRRFDWIVLDPPSFGTRAGGVLSAERDYAGLVRGALALLQPRGSLLCVSHQRKISDADLARLVARACEAAGCRARVEPLCGGWDCPTLPGVSGTKSVLARRS